MDNDAGKCPELGKYFSKRGSRKFVESRNGRRLEESKFCLIRLLAQLHSRMISTLNGYQQIQYLLPTASIILQPIRLLIYTARAR